MSRSPTLSSPPRWKVASTFSTLPSCMRRHRGDPRAHPQGAPRRSLHHDQGAQAHGRGNDPHQHRPEPGANEDRPCRSVHDPLASAFTRRRCSQPRRSLTPTSGRGASSSRAMCRAHRTRRAAAPSSLVARSPRISAGVSPRRSARSASAIAPPVISPGRSRFPSDRLRHVRGA